MKITLLELENVKRIKAVSLSLGDGLNIVAGKNDQGKSSVLDGLLYLLAGKAAQCERPVRDGANKSTLRCTLDDGVVITCDVDTEATAIAQEYWAQSPHGKKIDLRLGPALETMAAIDGPLDVVFIDADKAQYIDYLEAVVPKVRTGGVVLADNVLWKGHVLDPQEPNAAALAAFNNHVVRDDRVEVVMLPLRDGLTLAVKL